MTISVREDKSFVSEVDTLAIENGIAELGIHSIHIDRFYTEEQREQNLKTAQSMSKEEWSSHCENVKVQLAGKIEHIMDTLNDSFKVYQYKDNDFKYSSEEWDLFFWCNMGDMSYVTLNPNRQRPNEQRIADIQKAVKLIESLEVEGIGVSIQYTTHYNKEMVKEIRGKVCRKLMNQMINYRGLVGKIKEVGKTYSGETTYGFFKKGAKKKYYEISDSWCLMTEFSK